MVVKIVVDCWLVARLQAFSLVCADRCKILVKNYFCLKMKPTPAGWNVYRNNIQYRNSTPKESYKSFSFYFYKHLNPTVSDYLRTANSLQIFTV